MRDERAGLGVHLAPLEAEAPVDAVRPVPEAAVRDRHGAHAHLDAARACPLPRPFGGAAHGMRAMWIVVRIAPWPPLPGHGELTLEHAVVLAQVGVADRPVSPDAVHRTGREIRGMKPWRIAGEVRHRAAHAEAAVVLPHLDGVLPGDDSGVVPVEMRRAGLVRHPVAVGVPERPPLQDDDAPPGPRKPLGEHAAPGAAADDRHVDRLVVAEPAHPVKPRDAAPVRVEQEVRAVHSSPRSLTSRTGSSSNASRPSHGSWRSTPRAW